MTTPTTATGYGLIIGCLLILAGIVVMTWLRSAAAERRARFVVEVTALTADNRALAAELDELNGRLQDLLDTAPLDDVQAAWEEHVAEGLAQAEAAAVVPLPGRRLSSVPTQRGAVD